MRDALKSYLALAAGVTDLTRQRALSAAKALVSQGEASAEQVTGLAEDLLAQTRQNREAVVALVSFEVDRALGLVGLASADEVAQLVVRVGALEAEVRGLTSTASASPAPAVPGPPAAKAGPAKAGPAKVTPGKSPAKGAPAKRASARPAPPKRSAPASTPAAGPGDATTAGA